MFVEGEAVLAFCYIGKEGDDKNICYLTKENLLIRYKSRLSKFSHSEIQGMSFEHKILLFPLILGGIITPLSIHGLLNTFLNPWLLLTCMVSGLFLMYYGWDGSSTMTVKTKIKDYDFFIRQPSSNLKAFAEYVQHYISDDVNARRFYFIINKNEWTNTKAAGLLNVKQPIHLYNWRDIHRERRNGDNIILAVDPTENDIQITFQKTSDNKNLQPVISKNIPIGDIHEVKGLN